MSVVAFLWSCFACGFGRRFARLWCSTVCAEFAGLGLRVGYCVAVSGGVIGVEQAALYDGRGATVLCSDFRSAGV